MPDLFATPAMQAVVAITVLVVLTTFAFWLLRKLRDYTTQDRLQSLHPLTNLEEMLRNGDISEAEFRTIQASARSRTDHQSGH